MLWGHLRLRISWNNRNCFLADIRQWVFKKTFPRTSMNNYRVREYLLYIWRVLQKIKILFPEWHISNVLFRVIYLLLSLKKGTVFKRTLNNFYKHPIDGAMEQLIFFFCVHFANLKSHLHRPKTQFVSDNTIFGNLWNLWIIYINSLVSEFSIIWK